MIIPGVHPFGPVAPGGAYSIRPYTGTIIRAIGPPHDTVIRARGARPGFRPGRRNPGAHGYPGRPDGPTSTP